MEAYIKQTIGEIGNDKGIRLLDYEAVIDHVHLLIEIGADENLSAVVKLLKGTSSRRVFQKFAELKLDARTSNFWQRRYGSKIVEPNSLSTVSKYIRTQKERLEKYER
ncbi:MAG: IS200/IS605 family transposase [Chloroflexi bacterium]|nr:IS200/IS605 family transposase [Chloroflexota bacterium]